MDGIGYQLELMVYRMWELAYHPAGEWRLIHTHDSGHDIVLLSYTHLLSRRRAGKIGLDPCHAGPAHWSQQHLNRL